jgi:hypothetical protein
MGLKKVTTSGSTEQVNIYSKLVEAAVPFL